ncbi:MAG: hypothetical protein E5X44_05970 [Mesorhizobium sp.]|nr:MAG: hypothetical protein E5X44_05970 [Mesorhizobium sp.]
MNANGGLRTGLQTRISLEQAAALARRCRLCRHQRRNCRALTSQGSASLPSLPVAKVIAAD